jgi:ABC-type amino acid transport system permease subunit
MPHDLVAFGAIFFCGLALIPAAAHAMELPNKIRLAKEEYFVAQKLYRGWELVAPIVILALVSTAMLFGQARAADPRPEVASMIAFICVAATQVVFWVFTFPVNRATQNWTQAPTDWERLRRRWEYSHATSAVLNLVAFVATVLATLWS